MASSYVSSTSAGLFTVYGFAGVLTAAKTLSITAQAVVAHTGTGGSSLAVLTVSLDGGSTWSTVLSTSVSVASTVYTVSLASGQDLSQVRINAACNSTSSPSQASSSTAELKLSLIHVS